VSQQGRRQRDAATQVANPTDVTKNPTG
jgi:hypothetical protein